MSDRTRRRWPLRLAIGLVALVVCVYVIVVLGLQGTPDDEARSVLGLSLVAPLLVALTLWAIAPGTAWVVDTVVLDTADMAPSLAIFGAGFGAFIGALFGALLGIARALLERYDPEKRPLHHRFSMRRTSSAGPSSSR